jgi:hypothetical protein
VPFLVPRLGERVAELIETPFMFVVVLLSARFIAKQFALPATISVRLGAGFLALGLLLMAEIVLVVALQGRALGQYVASQDPVSGSVYLVMLALFAFMPLIIARAQSAQVPPSRERVQPCIRDRTRDEATRGSTRR